MNLLDAACLSTPPNPQSVVNSAMTPASSSVVPKRVLFGQDGTQEEEEAHAFRNKNVSLMTALSTNSMNASKLVRIKYQANGSVDIHSLHHGWTHLHANIGLQASMIMAFFEEPLMYNLIRERSYAT